ncbi:ferric reductase-like transmembrane domain-containing protein [Nocardioides sp. Soil777]|uniref:ferredoxin reductase family protein n=1 Tax=Nocardioides sp. Soil777 TaxID=1736409 RepID=UPI0009E72F09|nr:ferredoxin reductase family protein [Nocardioides sp. Soil777]
MTPSRATLDLAVRRAAATVLGGSLALVTWWWIDGGGLGDLAGWTTALTSLGRWTGLVASVLLLAQVLLMARVPVLERAFGQDRLAHVHRTVGFTSFNLMLAHVVLITWGYAAGSLLRWPAELWDLTRTYPALLLADAGFVALVLVVVTSVRAARRRLRYESWHLMHLYAYLGAGLALPHQLWTGQELVSSTGRAIFWWTAWGAAAGAVLVWRVALPVSRNLRHRLRVEEVVEETPGVVSVVVTGRRLDRLPVQGGQWMSWRFLGRDGWTRANPYSLSAAPDGRRLRITVQSVGDGSGSTATLSRGTRVLVEGPYGRLSPRSRHGDKVALIGAGVGSAPLVALAEELAPDGDVVVLHRSSGPGAFTAELERLAARGVRVLHLPGRRRGPRSWLGDAHAGRYSDLVALRHWVPDIAGRDVYVCGPTPWADLVVADLRRAGVRETHIHVEAFGW